MQILADFIKSLFCQNIEVAINHVLINVDFLENLQYFPLIC